MSEWFQESGVPVEHLLYLLALLLVVAVLAAPFRRIGMGQLLGYTAAWVAIFGVGWLLLARNPEFQRYLDSVSRDAASELVEEDVGPGGELRVPAAVDGHFWVRAQVNGTVVRFLVDTGASDVVLSQRTAERVGIDPADLQFNRPGYSASGRVLAAGARVDRFALGPIERRNMPVSVIGGSAEINLLGMRFLRTLKSWRVEDDTLILVS